MTKDVAASSPQEIAGMVPDGATVALTGSGVFLEADGIFAAIERRFLETGRPRGLTIVHALGIGDGKGTGLGRFAHEGLVRRVIGGHWTWSPAMQRLARDDKIAAYSFPAGAIATLLREIGAGRPGLITRVGLGTFADPRRDGGRLNTAATEDLVELVRFDGEEWLRYKPLPIDVGIVRGSVIDRFGNLSCHLEPADLDAYSVALAAHNSGGVVLAQARERRDRRAIPARLVRVPGVLVDAVLIAPDARDTYLPVHEPRLTGEAPIAAAGHAQSALELPEGLRKIVAARALDEIPRDPGRRVASVNFGFGIPGGIPALAELRGLAYWGSLEQGIHNGAMLDGPMFGAARDPDAIVSSVDQFDFYSGGGIDVAFLGMGEMDGAGDVNVSKLNGAVIGPGGFIDITQTARKVVFCGAFEAKGLGVEERDGRLAIVSPGAIPKLVERVEHVTFSGAQARASGQEVLYVTERAVFRLGPERVELIELAPGIDLRTDVLDRMRFAPEVRL